MSVQAIAAMHEERGLVSYYRQRNQYLAETVLTLEAGNASLKAELDRLAGQIAEALKQTTEPPEHNEEQ